MIPMAESRLRLASALDERLAVGAMDSEAWAFSTRIQQWLWVKTMVAHSYGCLRIISGDSCLYMGLQYTFHKWRFISTCTW